MYFNHYTTAKITQGTLYDIIQLFVTHSCAEDIQCDDA